MLKTCDYCGSNQVFSSNEYQIRTKEIGTVRIKGIKNTVCKDCNAIYLSGHESKKVFEHIQQLINLEISNKPIKDFFSLNEAKDILGISKQAFNKNSRIKRGFIYKAEIDGRYFFLKDSVLAFKSTKDGRIPLKKDPMQDISKFLSNFVHNSKANNFWLSADFPFHAPMLGEITEIGTISKESGESFADKNGPKSVYSLLDNQQNIH